jgi:hypothetical protein
MPAARCPRLLLRSYSAIYNLSPLCNAFFTGDGQFPRQLNTLLPPQKLHPPSNLIHDTAHPQTHAYLYILHQPNLLALPHLYAHPDAEKPQPERDKHRFYHHFKRIQRSTLMRCSEKDKTGARDCGISVSTTPIYKPVAIKSFKPLELLIRGRRRKQP